MKKAVAQRRLNIKRLGQARNPDEIPYFKRVALDPTEHPPVRREAVIAIGSFGGEAIRPLTDILVECTDQGTKQTVMHLLCAFGRKVKTGWTEEMKEQLRSAILLTRVMVEGIR
jgi:hypothetical protein